MKYSRLLVFAVFFFCVYGQNAYAMNPNFQGNQEKKRGLIIRLSPLFVQPNINLATPVTPRRSPRIQERESKQTEDYDLVLPPIISQLDREERRTFVISEKEEELYKARKKKDKKNNPVNYYLNLIETNFTLRGISDDDLDELKSAHNQRNNKLFKDMLFSAASSNSYLAIMFLFKNDYGLWSDRVMRLKSVDLERAILAMSGDQYERDCLLEMAKETRGFDYYDLPFLNKISPYGGNYPALAMRALMNAQDKLKVKTTKKKSKKRKRKESDDTKIVKRRSKRRKKESHNSKKPIVTKKNHDYDYIYESDEDDE